MTTGAQPEPPSFEDASAIFLRDGDAFIPTAYAGGPWDPNAQHGAAACGLLARNLEACETPVPMRISRVTFELMRSVPLRRLTERTEIVRRGKRIQLALTSLFDGDTEVARATGSFIRTTDALDLEGGPNNLPEAPLPTAPGTGIAPVMRIGARPGFLRATNFVRADGEPDGRGPSSVWLRLNLPLVEGEATSPFVRLAALSDFASGISNALDFSRLVSINPDVSLHVLRPPRSEWIGIEGTTHVSADGTGQSDAKMYDAEGLVAFTNAALFIDSR